MSITHKYYTRAKCVCGYMWTTEEYGNVVCKCGKSEIIGKNVLGIANLVSDEEDFKLFVSQDINVDLVDLVLVGV